MITKIFIYVAIIFLFIGFCLLNILQRSRAKRDGGCWYSDRPIQVTDKDKKLFKIALILMCLGILIFVILRIVVGPTIYLGC
jgi:archaellum biogenesis protein FlaJ (TadC family)